MVVPQPSKLMKAVRFRYPAPKNRRNIMTVRELMEIMKQVSDVDLDSECFIDVDGNDVPIDNADIKKGVFRIYLNVEQDD